MINTIKKLGTAIVSMTVLAAPFVAAPVFAQTVSTSANVSVSASTTITTSDRLPTVISKGDAAIAARLVSLNDLSAKVQDMKNVSASEKASIAADVQTNISGLTALKAKLDADTDISVARTDAKSIFGSFRIYALVIPQGYIAVAADKVSTIGSLMTGLSVKLQSRITADQAKGDNVASLQASLNDIATQVTNANAQATLATNATANLTPDQGNATVAASNKAALVAARGNTKTATADLKAARKDIQTITVGLKAFN